MSEETHTGRGFRDLLGRDGEVRKERGSGTSVKKEVKRVGLRTRDCRIS